MKILTVIENPQAHSSRSVVMHDGNALEMGQNIVINALIFLCNIKCVKSESKGIYRYSPTEERIIVHF